MDRIVRVLNDDSGFILRGAWAVAFLAFLFMMAIFGQIPWEGFLTILLASMVLTGLGALFSRPSPASFEQANRINNSPPNEASFWDDATVTESTGAADVECLGCATAWELDEIEAQQPSFTCPDCGRLMDSGRFVKRVPPASDDMVHRRPSTAAAEVECIDCGAEWLLDAVEAARPSFTCPDCGRLMDADRFTKPHR